tara:strand:- start:220 stop:483 length:264 start_codon:yes stop_codon:yes gene_type:complete
MPDSFIFVVGRLDRVAAGGGHHCAPGRRVMANDGMMNECSFYFQVVFIVNMALYPSRVLAQRMGYDPATPSRPEQTQVVLYERPRIP